MIKFFLLTSLIFINTTIFSNPFSLDENTLVAVKEVQLVNNFIDAILSDNNFTNVEEKRFLTPIHLGSDLNDMLPPRRKDENSYLGDLLKNKLSKNLRSSDIVRLFYVTEHQAYKSTFGTELKSAGNAKRIFVQLKELKDQKIHVYISFLFIVFKMNDNTYKIALEASYVNNALFYQYLGLARRNGAYLINNPNSTFNIE